MNKIQICLLIVSLWVISCSSGPKEAKESSAVVEGTPVLPELAPLPVTFLPLDSLTLFPDAILELNTIATHLEHGESVLIPCVIQAVLWTVALYRFPELGTRLLKGKP